MTKLDRAKGALLGLACGDALGTTIEFEERGSFTPLTEIVGGGPFHLEKGQWTDDTSMALCLAESLIHNRGMDLYDQSLGYCRWFNKGYMSCTGTCFDIGMTVRAALNKFATTSDPRSGATHERSAGNGSIMRLAPVPIYFHDDEDEAHYMSGESSVTTHGTAECIEACELFGRIIWKAINGHDKFEILANLDKEFSCPKVQAIANVEYRNKTYEEIVGSGYVIQSLEAALWCFLNSSSYKEAVLLAANLGDDADTTAAVCGQIAGAFYGMSGIPQNWLECLAWKDKIERFAELLYTKEEVED